MRELENKIEQLRRLLDDTSEINGTNAFLETKAGDDGAILMRGNAEGLLCLAQRAVELASTKINNKHFNFDEASELDACERALILGYQSAPWEDGK